MPRYWKRLLGYLTVTVLFAPLALFAQDGRRSDRLSIQVINNWENTVHVTLWNERGGQMTRRSWTIPQGQSAILADESGRSLWVGGSDKIKVGNDWGRVDIGAVGQLQGRIWYVRVRDVWQATHHRGRPRGLPPDQPETRRPYYRR
jgi:hypothetical protein